MSRTVPLRNASRLVLFGALLLTAAGAQIASPLSADAAGGDPVRERGVVSRVVDGDTIDVRVDGHSTDTRVRLSGIQAFETGECGGDVATARLAELVEDEQVTLRAKYAGSSSLGRPIRSVHLEVAGGTLDVTERMLFDGMGLWFPIAPELTGTSRYQVAATHAREAGRGIWRDDLCGEGPSAGHDLDMWVKWDADSDDSVNVEDEYVVIVNRDSSAIDLSGWLLRESSQFPQDVSGVEGYRIPSGTTVPAGERLVVSVGRGADSGLTRFMGSDVPLFDNVDRSVGTGDGAYLLDPRGNVRLAFTYPCVIHCSSPLAGALEIDHVEYDPGGVDTADTEYVRLRNTSGSTISLDGYQLRNITVAHEFEPGTRLAPQQTLEVYVGEGTATATTQYWGQSGPILANGGDNVDVVSFDERSVDCVAWGSGRPCPTQGEVPGQGSDGSWTGPALDGDDDGRVFDDVPPSHPHAASIAALVELEVTLGYDDGTFRPNAPVSREQMATFLVRAIDGLDPVPGTPPFPDVSAANTHAANINAVALAEIAGGYPDGSYGPSERVSREQMATFIARAAELEEVGGTRFPDVARGNVHRGRINAVAEAGIAQGRTDGTYGPKEDVTRGQMATFLMRLLG